MSDLLGKSIENASEHHSVISLRVGVEEKLEFMDEVLQDGDADQRDTFNYIMENQEDLHSKLKKEMVLADRRIESRREQEDQHLKHLHMLQM